MTKSNNMGYKYIGTYKGIWSSCLKNIQTLDRVKLHNFKIGPTMKVMANYCVNDCKITYEFITSYEDFLAFEEMYQYHGNGD